MYSRFDDIKPNRVDDFFAHHGIKGQKWGVRNYQNPDGTLTEAGKKRYYKGTGRKKASEEEKKKTDAAKKYEVNSGIKGASKSEDDEGPTTGYKVSNDLTLGQTYTIRDDVVKRYLVAEKTSMANRKYGHHYEEEDKRADYKKTMLGLTAAYAGVGAASGGLGFAAAGPVGAAALGGYMMLPAVGYGVVTASRLHSATRANKKLEKVMKEIDNNPNVDEKTGLKLINKTLSEKENMEKVNPGYKNFADTTKHNCMLCTTTYDLRRRGYDVTAGAVTTGFNDGVGLSWYKNAKLKVLNSNSSGRAKYRELADLPDGSCGNLTVVWAGSGGGHSMFFEVKDGKPIIRDCQTNEVLKGNKVKNLLDTTKECKYILTNNVEPNIAAMRKSGVFYDGSKKKETKIEVKHFYISNAISFDDLVAGVSIEHHGIKNQKWGERRYQYEDGSLTPAGRIRYLKGGDKEIRKAEKQRAKREAILSDRKKLYKHRDEFTKEELDKAMEKFASEDKMKAQIEAEKEATRRAKEEKRQAKYDYKKMKLQAKMEERKLKEQDKQNKMQTEQKRLETEAKEKTANATSKAELWKQRANKAKSIFDFAKTGRDILGDMGIISKEGNESLFGALAESIGLKDNSGAQAAAKAKKDREKLNADYDLENKRLSVENAKLRNEQLRATIAKTLGSGAPQQQGGQTGGGNNNPTNPTPTPNPPKNPSGGNGGNGGNQGGGNNNPKSWQPVGPAYDPSSKRTGSGTPLSYQHNGLFASLDISSYLSNPTNESYEFERHQTKKGNLDKRYHSSKNLSVMDRFKGVKMSDIRDQKFYDSSGTEMAKTPNDQTRLNSVGTRIEDFFKILNAKGVL